MISKFKIFDRVLMVLGLCLMLLSLYLMLVDPELYHEIIFREGRGRKVGVAKVELAQADAKFRPQDSYVWRNLEVGQELLLGDRIFVARASSASLRLKGSDAKVDLSAGSLLTFALRNQVQVADLQFGHFKISIKERLQILIKGQMATFESRGQQGEFEVRLNHEEEPLIRPLVGQITLRFGNSTEERLLKIAENFKVETSVQAVRGPEVATDLSYGIDQIRPTNFPQEYIYTFAFHDLYFVEGSKIKDREDLPGSVKMDLPIQIQNVGSRKEFYLEHGQSDGQKIMHKVDPLLETFKLSQVYIGENILRISRDQNQWSDFTRFFVRSEFDSRQAPEFSVSRKKGGAPGIYEVLGSIAKQSDFKNFILERSNSLEFPRQRTQIKWISQSNFHQRLPSAGEYYFRIRGVTSDLKLSEFSAPLQIQIDPDQPLYPPDLPKQDIEGSIFDRLELGWNQKGNESSYQIEIEKQGQGKILDTKLSESKFSWVPNLAGNYKLKVYSLDKEGRRSRKASEIQLRVKDWDLGLNQEVAGLNPEDPDRDMSSTPESLSIEMKSVQSRTSGFASSKLSANLSLTSLNSDAQVAGTAAAPYVVMSGLSWGHWMGRHGSDLRLQTKVASLNESAKTNSPTRIEAHYRYRWLKERSQVFVLAGLESYRNSNPEGSFASKADLAKVGLGLNLPFLEKWESGGELLFGQSFSEGQKYELAGSLNYQFKQFWSLGLGYRASILKGQKSSSSSEPKTSFQENSGEAFTNIQLHY